MAEMNTIHGSICCDYQLLACGNLDHGGVITDVLRRFSPLREENANNVELLSRAELDVGRAGRFVGAHRATAGSSAITGGFTGASPPLHARGGPERTAIG